MGDSSSDGANRPVFVGSATPRGQFLRAARRDTLRDTPAYDEAAAERRWQTMLALFDATLKDKP